MKLEAESWRHYRVCGLLDEEEGFAEIWIEDAATDQPVTESLRIPSLEWL
jgi:hypothetical protein